MQFNVQHLWTTQSYGLGWLFMAESPPTDLQGLSLDPYHNHRAEVGKSRAAYLLITYLLYYCPQPLFAVWVWMWAG